MQSQVKWAVLLDEDDWDKESVVFPAQTMSKGDPRGHPATRSLTRRATLLVLLLAFFLLLANTIWGHTKAAQSQRAVANSAPPVSVDVLAAHARAIHLTEHLRIAATGTDLAIVAASAEEMEALYLNTFAAAGLAPIQGKGAPDGRLFVEVRDAGVPVWNQARGWVTLPSPESLPVPVRGNLQALLSQAWLLALIDQTTREAWEVYKVPRDWLPLLGGLRLWLLWDAGGPLAQGWNEAVAEMYGEGGGHLSPEEVRRICQAYALWDLAPIDFSIPLGCALSLPIAPHFRASEAQLTTLGLPTNKDSPETQYGATWPTSTNRRIALALLIEYGVEEYGRKTLPQLLASLQVSADWDTLIPAAYGVSAEEFEMEWQMWLTEKYGL